MKLEHIAMECHCKSSRQNTKTNKIIIKKNRTKKKRSSRRAAAVEQMWSKLAAQKGNAGTPNCDHKNFLVKVIKTKNIPNTLGACSDDGDGWAPIRI